MAKNKISDYSSTASQNTDIGNININEGCAPSNINNAIRELMAQIKDFQQGADGDGLTVSTLNATTATIGNIVISSYGAITATSLSVSGSSVLASANISGALTTATANITTATIGAVQGTSATFTNALPVASGGTSLKTLTAENVLIGNGTSAVKFVAPGTSGNVLTSNGTVWSSAAPSAPSSLSTASGSAPSYSARAWVNFDGTTSPGTIRGSGNVSSVTRNATGDFTINFSTAMSDNNYSVCGTARRQTVPIGDNTSHKSVVAVNGGSTYGSVMTTTSVRIATGISDQSTLANWDFISIVIFR
jgi:hypothetical protein